MTITILDLATSDGWRRFVQEESEASLRHESMMAGHFVAEDNCRSCRIARIKDVNKLDLYEAADAVLGLLRGWGRDEELEALEKAMR